MFTVTDLYIDGPQTIPGRTNIVMLLPLNKLPKAKKEIHMFERFHLQRPGSLRFQQDYLSLSWCVENLSRGHVLPPAATDSSYC